MAFNENKWHRLMDNCAIGEDRKAIGIYQAKQMGCIHGKYKFEGGKMIDG